MQICNICRSKRPKRPLVRYKARALLPEDTRLYLKMAHQDCLDALEGSERASRVPKKAPKKRKAPPKAQTEPEREPEGPKQPDTRAPVSRLGTSGS